MCDTNLCKNQCVTCPFSHTQESEYAQGLGCLPDPFHIVEMKRISGHNWGCHYNENRVCAGFIDHITEYYPELDPTHGGIISYDAWYRRGPEQAMEEANGQ